MADEIVSGSGAGASVIVAQIARRVALRALADRFSLRNHPALVNVGDDLVGAGTIKGSILGLDGVDEFAARTEIQSVANTVISSDNYTLNPSRVALARGVSDYIRMIDPTGSFDEMTLAMDSVSGYAMTFTTKVGETVDGFTQVGTSGSAFSHDRFLLGQFAMKQASVDGPWLYVLHPDCFVDWQADLESRGGMTQWRAATEQMQMLRGTGYEGNYNGIDVVTTTRVQGLNADADHGNAIFGRGAVVYKEAAPPPPARGQDVLLDAGPLRVSAAYDPDTTVSRTIGNAWLAVNTGEGARGRTVLGAQAA